MKPEKHDRRDFWILAAVIFVLVCAIALRLAGDDLGGDRTMYVPPWVFVLLLLLSSLSVSGAAIAVIALVVMWLRRIPHRQPKPKPDHNGIVGPNGKPL